MPQSLDNLSTNWTSTATLTGIKFNVATDTGPSNAASNLLDLQVGGVTKFRVGKGVDSTKGDLNVGPLTTNGVRLQSYDAGGTGKLVVLAGDSSGFAPVVGSACFGVTSVGTGSLFYWGSFGTIEAAIFKDAANTLAQRNGTNPQAFRIYNTFTDTLNNFERGKIAWESNVLRIGTEKGLTAGTARALELQTDGTTRLVVSSTESRLGFGGLDATNPSIYRSGNTSVWFITGNNATFCNIDAGVFVSRSGSFLFTSSGRLDSTVDGVIKLANNANNDFGRLQFGGTTSSFPALKRSTTSLQARLADDSAFTNIQGKLTADTNAVAETPTATHTITIYDAAGTGYKVLCVAA